MGGSLNERLLTFSIDLGVMINCNVSPNEKVLDAVFYYG